MDWPKELPLDPATHIKSYVIVVGNKKLSTPAKHRCPRLKTEAHVFPLPFHLTTWPDTVESVVTVGSTAILHILFNARFIQRAGSALGETRRRMDRQEEHENIVFKLEQISRWHAPHSIIWAWSKLKLLYVNYYLSKTHFHQQLFKNLHKLRNRACIGFHDIEHPILFFSYILIFLSYIQSV